MITDLILNSKNPIVISNNLSLVHVKDEVLKLNKLVNVVYKTYKDVEEELIGSYKIDAYLDFCKQQNISLEIANMYLKNSLLVDDNINHKTKVLLDLKNKYQEYLPLINDNIKFYEDKTIILYNYFPTHDKFIIALNKISNFSNIKYYYDKPKINNNIKLYKFESYKQEVYFLGKQIATLLDKGVKPENIKINRLPIEYHPVISEVFSMYDIDIDLGNNVSLFEKELTKQFLSCLLGYLDEDSLYAFLKVLDHFNKLKLNEEDKEILNQIISLLNDLIILSYKLTEVYEAIIYKLKHTKVRKQSYTNIIEFVNFFDYIPKEDDYLFVLSFNQDIVPITHKDDDYLLDNEKRDLGLLISSHKNKAEKEKIIHFLKLAPNIILSYSLEGISGVKVKSSTLNIIEEDFLIKEEIFKDDYQISYSKLIDKNKLAKYMDLYYKYGFVDKELLYLNYNYQDINYRKYSHGFSGIDYDVLKNYLENNFKLSYTSLDTYYKCGFKFYLERILKVHRQTNEESLYIGNLFHYCLNILLKNEHIENIDEYIDQLIDDFIKMENKELSKKDKFFIRKFKESLLIIYNEIRNQMECSEFKINGLEKEYNVFIDGNYPVTINGKIDKVLTYKFNGEDYAIVIDYKTGSTDFDLNRIYYGINMQIMFYFYFLNNENEKYKFGGGYLEGILPSAVFKKIDDTTYLEQYKKYVKLSGYSNKNMNLLQKIDKQCGTKDSFIQGIKFKKDGNYDSYSFNKIIDDETFDQLLSLTKQKINDAIINISNGEFKINPIKLGNVNSCSFCPYFDICFRDTTDISELKEFKNFSFLGGEDDDTN